MKILNLEQYKNVVFQQSCDKFVYNIYDNEINILGQTDIIADDNVIQLKYVNQITVEMILQISIY